MQMTEATRKTVLAAYQQRKREEVTHPLLDQKVPVGRLPFLQVRICPATFAATCRPMCRVC